MAVPKEILWELEPHTKAKHDILRRYLEAWFPILNRYGRIIYIDGFAGPGRYKTGEPGSPLIALDVASNHRQDLSGEVVFWFIEKEKDRYSFLKKEIEELSLPDHFVVEVECGEFIDKIQPLLDDLGSNDFRLAPTFAFVDPFGFKGIPFSFIRKIMSQRSSEIFITFMVDAVNRWVNDPKVGKYIVELFGTEKCIDIAKNSQNRIHDLMMLYQSQLERVAKHVRYFEMRDKNDRPQYYLFFSTNHPKGFVKIKEAMWMVDTEGEFSFSDANNPNQIILFKTDTTPDLIGKLRAKFKVNKKVTGKKIREYIEEETIYLKKHMTKGLKYAEEKGIIDVSPTKVDGSKRSHGFPDGVIVSFK
jgi:three-Cys-motif partner protein